MRPESVRLEEAISRVKDELKKDESSRSILVMRKEFPKQFQFQFEIAPNKDLKGFFDQCCRRIAEEERVSFIEIERRMEPILERYSIEPDIKLTVLITAPKNREEKATYLQLNGTLSYAEDGSFSTVGKATLAHINDSKDWRYANLLDLE